MQTIVRVYAKAIAEFFPGHCWGGVGAPFLANIAPEKYLYIKWFPEKGAYGAMFFQVSVYEQTGTRSCHLGNKTFPAWE